MAKAIELSASASSVFRLYTQWGFDFQASSSNLPEMAVEFDVWVSASPSAGDISANYSDSSVFRFGAPSNILAVDQNGYAKPTGGKSSPLFQAYNKKWLRRVFKVAGLAEVNLELQASGGFYKHRYANVCITSYREPVLWLWREGMPLPNFFLDGSIIGGASIVDVVDEFPLAFTKVDSPEVVVDEKRVDRASGGRLRSWTYWDRPKSSFQLTFPLCSEVDRQNVDSFYQVYRGSSDRFLWRHRADYPAQLVAFAEPPRYRPVRFGADARYDISVVFQEV